MAGDPALAAEQAAAARRQGNWRGAQQLYEAAAARLPGRPELHHNLALCLYAQGLHQPALEHAWAATRRAPRMAQAWVLRGRIERALDKAEAAEDSLRRALEADAADRRPLIDLAGLRMNELGDAAGAQRLVAPLVDDPRYAEAARLALLMARLYDREESAEALNRQIIDYSRTYLRLPAIAPGPRAPRRRGAPRIGLLSPLFCASPVFFLAYGALARLQGELDFVVLNRGVRRDWATARFRKIARGWHDVAHLPAAALASFIRARELDALLDLGGWTDPAALKALSARPAPRLYKWVGGQCCTTGLEVFDGYLTDREQTPGRLARLYTEPLMDLGDGYVSYEPPPYAPGQAPAAMKRCALAVVANPAKVSAAFLRELGVFAAGRAVRFIDRRYRHAEVRERIAAALRGRPEFVAPGSHREYLAELARVDCVIDTWPYNGGLTTLEALHAGARCRVHPGRLFCERHSASHLAFAPKVQSAEAAHRRLARRLATILAHG